MNIARLQKVRDTIRKEDVYFNMTMYFRNGLATERIEMGCCGTPSCIAGHILASLDSKKLVEFRDAAWTRWAKGFRVLSSVAETARLAVGISEQEAYWLFNGQFASDVSMQYITREQAIKAIDFLIAGGIVLNENEDWTQI